MGRWSRQELEDAFDRYQEEALKAARTGEWRHWANLFTEDATYKEHAYGGFCSREAIYRWIQKTMTTAPGNNFDAFPVTWYVIDEDKGWIVCEVMNRLRDPGDGSIWEEPNITILKYAGQGRFKYEEDAYNPMNFGKTLEAWQKHRDKLAGKKKNT